VLEGVSNANYARQLLEVIGRVNGLATSRKEDVGKLMLDREAWRSRISMIAKENISSHSWRSRTRSNIVVWY
jgi:hypothetical protein